jgi:predicted ribosome quality control (RQC) complex YloA/Tae2 family protein
MSFDGITLNAVKQELEKMLLNSRIDKVYQPDKQTIILKFRTRSGSHYLLLSCRADAARIHLIDKKPENPLKPPVFCMVLRKHLESGQLISIEQKGLERILTFNFQSVSEAGSVEYLALYCEIMGKDSNIVLVAATTNRILDGAKRFTHEVNRHREVLPGIDYIFPPDQDKQNILVINEDRFYTLMLSQPLENKLDAALLKVLEGFSPLLCREAVFRTGLKQDMTLNECGEYELRGLWKVLSQMAASIASGAFMPTLILEGKKYWEYTPFDLTMFESHQKQQFDTVNNALKVLYEAKDEALRINESKHRLDRVVNTQIKRLRNKLAAQEQDFLETDTAEIDRISGELITANMYAVTRGDTQLTTPNYYDPGQNSIVIELDPSLTPSQNAQRYFKKYRKAAVKRQKATEYIGRFQEELKYLDTVSTAISQAVSRGELEEIEEELVNEGYIKKVSRKAAPRTPGYLTFKSSDGFIVMVGKNNRQNDFLTMKTAKTEDIWLHTKDMPGAHVIVRTEGRTIPESTLLEAAILAAFYSKGKLSGNVPVDYTLREHVRKPRGAKPGLVIYDHQSTLFVTPDEEKIRSLQIK